jgi:integrase
MPLKLVKKGKVWHITGRVNGRRHRESTKTTNRETAESIRKERERDLEDRAYNHSACFADAVSVYIEKGGERRFLKPLMDQFEGKRLKDMTPVEVSTFSLARYSHLAPLTIKRELYTPLNAVMRAGHKAGLCPLIVFEAPKGKRKPVSYADDQWLRLFLDTAFPRIALTVLFLTLTGARVTEACNVTLGDLDLRRGFAVLRKTKNGKSRRVSLPPQLTEALTNWIIDQKLSNAADGVFGYSGRWSVNQAIERVCDRINLNAGSIAWDKVKGPDGKTRKVRRVVGPLAITYLTSHKVGRHAFAARLLTEGKSLRLVQEAGGWGTIQIVAETYGHLEQSHVDDALRESGSGLLTKMGSGVPMLTKPEISGHVLDTLPPDDDLVQAIRNRNLPVISGTSDGGRDRDRTCDPYHVKHDILPADVSEGPVKPSVLRGDHAGT